MPVLKRYNGTDWEVVGEAARPATRGATLGYAEATGNQTGISTETDLTGLSVTVTVPAGRRLKITAQVQVLKQGSTADVIGYIKEGSTTLNRFMRHEDLPVLGLALGHGEAIITPSAGTHTYKLSLQASAGTVDTSTGSTVPAFILVEDITGTPYVAGEAPPGALLAYVEQINSLSNIGTAEVDVPELAVTITVPEGRRIKLSAMALPISNSGANNKFNVKIVEGSTKIAYGEVNLLTSPHNAGTVEASRIISPTAGTHTYKVVGQFNAGATNMLYRDHSFGQVPYLRIEDVTGSPMPYDPASVPVGVIARTSLTTNFATASTTFVDVPGMSCNVAVPAGRTLKITLNGSLYSTVNGDTILGELHRNGVSLGEYIKDVDLENTLGDSFTAVVYDSPPAGAHVYQVKIRRFSGSGSVGFATAPLGTLTVEDVTPTPAPSSGAPGSTLGYAEVFTSQSGITSEVDLTGLSVTVTVPAGRRIRVSGQIGLARTVADGISRLRIHDNGSTVQVVDALVRAAGEGFIVVPISVVLSPSAGTHTFKLRLANQSGTGSSSMIAGVTSPAFILVEDITGSVWPEGSAVTAGMVASEPWTDYVPTLTQGVTVPKTVTYARYFKVGRLVTVQADLSITGAGTAGQYIEVGLPVLPAATGNEIGLGWVFDASASAMYKGTIAEISGSQIFRFRSFTSTAAGSFLGADVMTAALASGDVIRFTATYEAAS